jgi:sulfate transporter 4
MNALNLQIGADDGVEYNWQQMRWYANNWNEYVNPYAAKISMGIYIPLLAIWYIRKRFPPTPVRRTYLAYNLWELFSICSNLLAIVFAALATRELKKHHGSDDDIARLKIVGDMPSGLDIFRVPSFRWDTGPFIVGVLPLTVVAYMESYAVARKLGKQYGTLPLLNASQELFALGLGNILSCFLSGFPASGSLSRSALNASTGASSQLSGAVTTLIIFLALGTLTELFYWIPNAALSAVVFAAILNMLDPFEFYHAWRVSKRDCLVMVVTWLLTFLFSSEIGLAVGIALSVGILLRELAFALEAKPISRSLEYEGVEVIRLNSNLVFVSATRIKDTLVNELFAKPRSNESKLRAVIIDFIDVKHVDLSGVAAMHEVMVEARARGILFIILHELPHVRTLMDRMGVVSDQLTDLEPIALARTISGMIEAPVMPQPDWNPESLTGAAEMLAEERKSLV